MLAVSMLNTISSFISKALSDDSISDEEYPLILLKFVTLLLLLLLLQAIYNVQQESTSFGESEARK